MLGRHALSGVLALLLLNSATAGADALAAPARAEIAHLLDYLGDSGCDFYRNGSWHGAREARAHLARKGEYLIDRSLVKSADEFIVRAAAGSSMSGDPYLVRCRGNQPAPSADWLHAELERYRAERARR